MRKLAGNMNLHVKSGLLWNEVEMDPKFPTLHDGIIAVLDDCVAFRWVHPILDHLE